VVVIAPSVAEGSAADVPPAASVEEDARQAAADHSAVADIRPAVVTARAEATAQAVDTDVVNIVNSAKRGFSVPPHVEF
jgi:hypothetical protein